MPLQLSKPVRTLTIIALIALGTHLAAAQEKTPVGLKSGMYYPEVLRIKGAAMQKLEYEALRREVWIYKDGKLVFEQGRLKSWPEERISRPPETVTAAAAVSSQRALVRSAPLTAVADRSVRASRLLDEILKEVPSDDNPKSSSASVQTDMKNIRPIDVMRGARDLKDDDDKDKDLDD